MLKQIAGIIGWIGVAIVAFAVGIKLEIYLPGWVPYINYLLAAALVCILIYMLGEWQDIVAFFGKRQARYGTMSVVSILVGLGIVVAINYLGVRQNKRWDLTENQAFSLSEQSTKVLQEPRLAGAVHRLRPSTPTSAASAIGSTPTRTSRRT